MAMGDRRKFDIALICSFLIISSIASALIVFDEDGEGIGTRGTTLYVGEGQTYSSIQSAVDNASSGDTIRVFDGNYSEYIIINRTMSLIGNGTTRTNIIKDNDLPTGFFINDSENVEVSGFSFVKKDDSSDHLWIKAEQTFNLQIWNCEFINSKNSIEITRSMECSINDTVIYGTLDGAGILVEGWGNPKIHHNEIYNCTYGIRLDPSSQIRMSSVSWNIVYGNIYGIEFNRSCKESRIENNTVQYNTHGITFSSSCQENWIANNTVKNCVNGITLRSGCHLNTITYNTVLNNSHGIALRSGCSNNTISWNICNGQYYDGIVIDADWDKTGCRDNLIIYNEMKENMVGMSLNYSDRNSIERCIIEDNYLMGIFSKWSDYNNLHNCTISQNNIGLFWERSNWGSINFNLFEDNEELAINLLGGPRKSQNFRIHNNSFIRNNGATSTFNSSHCQVQSDSPNYWDDGIGHGNYWSDWTTPDIDSDGIVDSPYIVDQINTPPKVKDNYPLMEPPHEISYPPVIETVDVGFAYAEEHYYVQYEARDMDTMQSELEWEMDTNASWLKFTYEQVLNGTPSLSDVGSYWVYISVSDGNHTTFTNFTIVVYEENKPPLITTTDVTTCFEDQLYYVDYEAVDHDILTWSLATNATFIVIDSQTGILSGIPKNSDVGIYNVIINVTDGEHFLSTEFDLTVKNVNDPPEIGEDPSITVVYDPELRKYVKKKIEVNCTEDSPVYLNFSAYDQDPTMDTLTWTIMWGPSFLQKSSSQGRLYAGVLGVLNVTGTPTNDDVGKHNVTIRVADGNGGSDLTFFTLRVKNTNDAPTITTADQTTGYRNILYQVDYDAKDVDPTNDTLAWSMKTNATFLSLNSLTGVLSGTPGQNQIGQFWIHITVSDGKGGTDSSNYTLSILFNNSAPESTGPPQPLMFEEDSEDDSIDISSMFSDAEGDELEYYVETSENLNATITEDNKLIIEPRPDWAGIEFVRVFAFDGEYTTSVILTVVVENVNDQPSITNITFDPEMKEGKEILFRALAEDPDIEHGDSLTYEWYIEGLGLVGTGIELLIDLDAGEYTLTLVVTDSQGSRIEKELTFEVDKEKEATWWIPLLIFIIALLILMLFAVGIFFYRRRREEEDDFEFSGEGIRTSRIRKGPGGDRMGLRAEPMMDDDIAYGGPLSEGDMDIWDEPDLDDELIDMEDSSFIEAIEMEDDHLITLAYDEILSREEARDKSDIQELRYELKKRIIEEEGDEEFYDELNEILEDVEE